MTVNMYRLKAILALAERKGRKIQGTGQSLCGDFQEKVAKKVIEKQYFE
jgi:hypothetical protein